MLGDGALTFREYAMKEPVPLATIQDVVLEMLRARDDAVLFGPQAVNAYCDEPRMTQDVDIRSPNAKALVEAIRRKGQPKAGTDWRDLATLLLKFPELKTEKGPVEDRLHVLGADQEELLAWRALVHETIEPEPSDEEE